VAVPPQPSLAQRLAEAQKAAGEPARRVGDLERAKADAIAREDGAELDRIRAELAAAREEHAITQGTVTGLAAALADAQRRQAEDDQAAQQQGQRDDARRRIDAARDREAEALSELDAEVETMWAALEAVRRSFARGKALEFAAGQARTDAHLARVILGEAPAGMRMNAPNKMSALIEYHPELRAVLKCSR
jgi:chromosome segregation ATPase